MILCFDYGLKFIGVAIGQKITKTSNPLNCLYNNSKIFLQLDILISYWKPTDIIVGLNEYKIEFNDI